MAMNEQSMVLTESRDLRTGSVPWRESEWHCPKTSEFPSAEVDIAILGGGIMGAILAERLSASGRKVAVCDRRPPGCGSTAASTAQIMWAMDVPLLTLARTLGEPEAARRWKRVFAAVQRFGERLDRLGIDGKRTCPTLYLAGDLLDADGLREEAEAHRRHDLPSDYLDAAAVAERFGVAPRAGIVSSGSFSIDPVHTCHELLGRARQSGAEVVYPIDIAALHPDSAGIVLEASDGRSFRARDVILATGYERARLFLPSSFSLLSTFAIATRPGIAPLWREDAMIWEASDPYLYVRTTPDGRVIAGGEDVELADSDYRDALLPGKAGTIAAKLAATLGSGPIAWDRAWSATFGSSPDGLPAIGRSASMEHVWLAAGFGGNGIAFAALAAELLERELAGEPDPDGDGFDPYRFSS
ncbi:glycine/D-amino acid oxidase-like deaminating enzyme [Novosphingobium sp. ST904]|nr:glycine/D-amino acid oxidase-like deaminating enzyme [Novosphingobium sp. ST904]